jgi:hypothetical protein
MQDDACDSIEVPDWNERGDPPVDPKEARAIADNVHEMVTFIRQVAEREMDSLEKEKLLEDNYALLVNRNGKTSFIKLGGDEAAEGVHAMLFSIADKFKMILLRRNCHYIPREETFNYVQAGCPGYKNFKGAKRQLILDIESSIGSMQMLLKYEKNEAGVAPSSPELRCMHAASRNKWFRTLKPESPTAWFSDC